MSITTAPLGGESIKTTIPISENSTAIELVSEYILETLESSASTEIQLSNWSTHLYGEIQSAIYKMSKLPSDDEFFLEEKAAMRAQTILGFLREQMKMEPPKIINQNGEALTFTWDFGKLKRYLTVAEDEVDLMHLSKPPAARSEKILSQGVEIDFRSIFDHLSGEPRSSSLNSTR